MFHARACDMLYRAIRARKGAFNMKTGKLAVITEGGSDLLDLLRLSNIPLTVIHPGDILSCGLENYGAVALLGGASSGDMDALSVDAGLLGSSDKGLSLHHREAALIRKTVAGGVNVFAEYCLNLDNIYFTDIRSTRYERPVYVSDTETVPGLEPGDILDEQSNLRLNLWRAGYQGRPLLQYVRNAEGYNKTEVTGALLKDETCSALWYEKPNLLVCSFRLANFVKARFAPAEKWRALLRYIVRWLTGMEPDFNALTGRYRDIYHFVPYDGSAPFHDQAAACADRGAEWFHRAEMLIRRYGQYYGVKEGMGPAVYSDGAQQVMVSLRSDCTGETSLCFYTDYLRTGNALSKAVSDGLLRLYEDIRRPEESSPFRGMSGNLVVYQDDNARGVLMPILFRALYSGEKDRLSLATDALDFLIRTTGTDGLRVVRTDLVSPDSDALDCMGLENCPVNGADKWRWTFFRSTVTELARTPAGVPSAHYNAYYLGAMLLAHKVTGNGEYRRVGVRGLESIMALYPNTAREQSETEELCRLVFPLAMLYWVTREQKHRDWLYRVTGDLQRLRHPSGSYLEWDTGFTAVCSGVKDNECALLANNGDPIVDMLYSINWLPLGFIQAYFVTGDSSFKDLWEDVAKFFVSAQLHSQNRQLDGAWTRALDVDLMEVYGVPNDIGWAPWSIESGWTVGEIVTGLNMGLMADQLKAFYD